MAITARKDIKVISNPTYIRVPLAASETVYHGGFAVINDSGYCKNAASGISAKRVGIVKSEFIDSSTSSPKTLVATASNGSVETDLNCIDLYIEGIFRVTGNGFTQSDVGTLAFVYDNATVTCDAVSGMYPVGVVTRYISSTEVEIQLNSWKDNNDMVTIYGALTATSGVVAGAIGAVKNPFDEGALLRDFIIQINTAASSGTNASIGIANSSATAGTDLMVTATSLSYLSFLTTGTWSNAQSSGLFSTDLTRKAYRDLYWTSGYWVTISCTSAPCTSLAGWFRLSALRIG